MQLYSNNNFPSDSSQSDHLYRNVQYTVLLQFYSTRIHADSTVKLCVLRTVLCCIRRVRIYDWKSVTGFIGTESTEYRILPDFQIVRISIAYHIRMSITSV